MGTNPSSFKGYRRQIRIMKEMGLGGFFIFDVFTDLETRYLSAEWFVCVRACCEEAERLGMKAWLYDEDRYPSGAAGGRARTLPCSVITGRAKPPHDGGSPNEKEDVTTCFTSPNAAV